MKKHILLGVMLVVMLFSFALPVSANWTPNITGGSGSLGGDSAGNKREPLNNSPQRKEQDITVTVMSFTQKRSGRLEEKSRPAFQKRYRDQ